MEGTFVEHVRGRARLWLGLVWLAPMLVGFRLGLVPRERAKAWFLGHFLGGLPRARLEAAPGRYALGVAALSGPAAPRRKKTRQKILDLTSHTGLVFLRPAEPLIDDPVDAVVGDNRRHCERGGRPHAAEAERESVSS